MVEEQLRSRGIRDPRVLAAMGKVPREEFISGEDFRDAYGDHPLPIGAGQTVSQPYIVAAMVEALELRPADRVLEVGTGTGYEAAILASWLPRYGPSSATKSWPTRRARYWLGSATPTCTSFMATAASACPSRPRSTRSWWPQQRREFPRAWSRNLPMAAGWWCRSGTRAEQQVHIVRKMGNEIVVTTHDLCRFVPLVGAEGWQA